MFIETESTPNPATVKFIPHGGWAGPRVPVNFQPGVDRRVSPLAHFLFAIEGVAGVMIAPTYIAITKSPAYEWAVLKPEILATLMDHITSGEKTMGARAQEAPSPREFLDEISRQIHELIETRVRPAVAADGGDIVFSHFDQGVVYVHMQGACVGCPSSEVTLKSGIENMLRHFVPEVQEVRPLNNDGREAA